MAVSHDYIYTNEGTLQELNIKYDALQSQLQSYQELHKNNDQKEDIKDKKANHTEQYDC